MAIGTGGKGFQRWRRRRPFWGSLILLLAGLELFYSANSTLSGLQVHLGPTGFLSYLLPLLLLLCAVLCMFSPTQRLFYGIVALLTALYSFIGLNLGGFFLGMVLGIIGGALVIAWGPPRTNPETEQPRDRQTLRSRLDSLQWDSVRRRLARRDNGTKTLAILLVAAAVSATLLAVGSHTPAGAASCPEPLAANSTKAPTPATASSSASPAVKSKSLAASSTPKQSSPVINKDTHGSPVTSKEAQGPLVTSKEAQGSPVTSKDTLRATTSPAGPKATPTGAATQPTGDSVVPCLGARLFGKVASAAGLPVVANQPGLMKVGTLTLYNTHYDGVVTLPTATGSYRALKFSMSRASNRTFSLTLNEPNGGTTTFTSPRLILDGSVKFYTTELSGRLFGLIPVTFTPKSPPPLTLAVLSFTHVKIKLAYVQSNTLTGEPLHIASSS